MQTSVERSPVAIARPADAAAEQAAEVRPPDFIRLHPDLGEHAKKEIIQKIADWGTGLAERAGVRIVKSARRRTVARVEASGEFPAVYVKQERVLGFVNILKSMVTDSHACLEFRNAIQLAWRGVLAPRAVGYAEWRAGTFVQKTVCVMEELRGGDQLDLYFSKFSAGLKLQKIAAIAAALAELHHQAVDLKDCHRANLLAMEDSSGAPRLAVLDLATVEFRPMPVNLRVERVAQLLHSLEPVLDARERRDFVEHYARRAGVPSIAVDAFARRVREHSATIARERDRSRDRRCVSNSTEFQVTRGAGSRIYRKRSFPEAAVKEALDAIRGGASDRLQILKSEGRTECYLYRRPGSAPIFIKKIAARDAVDAFAAIFRGSRGMRAWKSSHALRRRGIATPEAFALVESGFLLPFHSTLITQGLEGAISLQNFTNNFNGNFSSFYEKRRFIESFALFVATLHLSRVDHDDLALKNFLLPESPRAEKMNIIDLEAVRSVGEDMDDARLLRAMMQLDDAPRAVSRADRMRFLVNYEKFTKKRFTRPDIAEIRRLLRLRFERSRRDYAGTGPR